MLLRCGHHLLDLATPRVMGILNLTPDSFSDGGRYVDVARAVEHGLAMVAAGADIIDVGGESTRPGAQAVSETEEIDRVAPVIAALIAAVGIPISVDTSKAGVITAALSAGASMINDVRALQEPGALAAAAAGTAAVCLMHMQGAPRTMQHDPQYLDVVGEVRDFLRSRASACEQAGIARERIVIDPGIGFGKRLEHNLALLAALPDLLRLELPVLIGVSRKSLLGKLLGRGVEQRLAGGIAIATASVLAGVGILRVHDVAETVDAVRVAVALNKAGWNAQREAH
jgi:dihydropteroate synthase